MQWHEVAPTIVPTVSTKIAPHRSPQIIKTPSSTSHQPHLSIAFMVGIVLRSFSSV
jgi:hypothetical protein